MAVVINCAALTENKSERIEIVVDGARKLWILWETSRPHWELLERKLIREWFKGSGRPFFLVLIDITKNLYYDQLNL